MSCETGYYPPGILWDSLARDCPILNIGALVFEKGICGVPIGSRGSVEELCQLRQLGHGCRPQGRYKDLRAQERLQGVRRKQQEEAKDDRFSGYVEAKKASISSEGHLSLGWQWSTVQVAQTHSRTCQSL